MINLIKAKSNKNKLGVLDNRPFAVDVELSDDNFFRIEMLDLVSGNKDYLVYENRNEFNEEWEVIYNIMYDKVNFGVDKESYW